MPIIKWYESDEKESEFDKRVNRIVWFSIACLVVGILITHYTH